MSSPARYNFTIYKGATFNRVFTWKDADGVAINLTGYTAAFRAKPSLTHAETLISKNSGSGITLGGAAGTVELTIPAAETAAIADDELVYSLTVTSGGGAVEALAIGTITVSPEVLT